MVQSSAIHQASAHDLEQHRTALTGHCYRMLGSASEADDAVQETMVRAWRSLDRFEGRSSLRTWLYRIATRVCLDALDRRSRRIRPMETGKVGTVDDTLTVLPGYTWIEPIPDAQALPADADPAERVALRQSIRLAFVAALQHLPPRQRAALLLTEVLGWPVAEVAESLGSTVAAINSALQRARATLAARDLAPGGASLSDAQTQLLDRFVDAFERYDVSALTELLHQDATLSMPPYTLWLQGPEAIRAWWTGRGAGCHGSRLVPTVASGLPAFGHYRRDPNDGRHRAWALIVLEHDGAQITGFNSFLDVATVFPRFGLGLELDP
jgi:RNA polymerase sigma-70 factor (ECF subfamily)